MRREGKIGRRKVFSKVKNVNVESLKIRSKLLDFWSGAQEWRVGEKERQRVKETKRGRVKESKRGRDGGTRHVTSYCHFLFYVRHVRCVRHVRYVRYKRYVRFAQIAPFAPIAPIAPIAHSRDSCSKFRSPVRLLSQNVGLLCPVCVWLRDFL